MTNDKYEVLKQEVLKLSKKYSTYDNIECIYFLPYIKEGVKRFDLYIVYKDPEEHFFTEIKELNEKYSSMTAKINGKLEVVPDPTCMYNIFATHDYECRRVRDLFSSTIIYDPDGFYYKAAHQFDRYNTVQKYTNVLDINMPIIK